MNVYMVRSDHEDRLYAALDCFHAIELDEQAYIEEALEAPDPEDPPPSVTKIRERYRREIFDQVVHIGELENWPKAVELVR